MSPGYKGCVPYMENHRALGCRKVCLHALTRAGVFEDECSNRLSLLVERSLGQQPAAVDAHTVIWKWKNYSRSSA